MSIRGSSFSQSSISNWMLSHSSEVSKQCDESTSAGRTNLKEQDALKEIQHLLAGTGVRGGYGTAQQKIEDFLSKYGKNEEIARLAPQLKGIADWCGLAERTYNDDDINSVNQTASDHAGEVQIMCDSLANDQKYGDIDRQELSSQSDQIFQMANNLTNSQNQTISAILTTLRG